MATISAEKQERRGVDVRAIWVAAIVVAIVIAAAVTATVAGILPTAQLAVPANVPELTVTAFQSTISPANAMVVVHERNLGPRSVISLLDQQSGQLLAQISAAGNPLVLMRPSRNELLVSDVVSTLGEGRGDPLPRLLAFDLTRGLALRGAPIPMADRTMYPIYTPSLQLSRDERFLYYMTRRDCGLECNEVGLGIVDLETQRQITTQLPVNCGHVLLTRWKAGDVVAMCPITGSLWGVNSVGTASLLAQFESIGLFAGLSALGEPYWINTKGQLVVRDSQGGVVIRKDLLSPADGALTGIYRWQLTDGRILLGVKPTPTAEGMGRVLVVNPDTWGVSTIGLPPGTTHLTPLGGDRIAAVHGRQEVTLLSATSGQPLGPGYGIPAGFAPWLIGP